VPHQTTPCSRSRAAAARASASTPARSTGGSGWRSRKTSITTIFYAGTLAGSKPGRAPGLGRKITTLAQTSATSLRGDRDVIAGYATQETTMARYQSILDTIGNTPLVRLSKLA